MGQCVKYWPSSVLFWENNFYVIPDDKAHFQFFTPPNVSIVFGLQLPNDWTVSHTDSIHWKITSYLYRLTYKLDEGEQIIKRKPSPFFLHTRKNPRILLQYWMDNFLWKYSHQVISRNPLLFKNFYAWERWKYTSKNKSFQ